MKKSPLIFSLVSLAFSGIVAAVELADQPLASGTTGVKPNLMFVLDDSGSMDWDYMPDNAKNFAGKYGFNSSQCNGVYYDPSYTYLPPVKSDHTEAVPSLYPNASFSAAWRDGFATSAGTVPLDTAFTGGSGSGSSGAASYSGPAFYYTYSGTQTTEVLRNYFTTSSTFYQECNSSVGASPGSAVFTKVRLASVPTTTITVKGGSATLTINSASSKSKPSVSSIKINGLELMSGSSSSSSSVSTVASNIAAKITSNGFTATASGAVVTIACTAAAGTSGPVLIYSGTMTYSTTACPAVTATTVSSITVGGLQLLSASASGSSSAALATDIKSKITATGYSATVSGSIVTVTGPAAASTLTPAITVASGSLTLMTEAFPESTPAKLQNFANWYSYYSNRMLMMKSGVGRAFSAVTDDYRVGFITMNNNVSPGIVDIADFTGGCAVGSLGCQRDKWYSKLYGSNANNSTPLREILSRVGQYYAHKFGVVDVYKSTITVSGSGSSTVDSITVTNADGDAIELMNDSSIESATTSQVAANIANQINEMQITDYGATVAGSVVTIYGPPYALGRTPTVSKSGSMTFTTSGFTKTSTTSTLNGITPADPMQYSCQQNYAILSTDGYWNGSTTYKLDGTTVGQQDGDEPRPMNDGKVPTKKTTTQILRSTRQNQQKTQQWQTGTSQLQQSTATLQYASKMQTQTASLQKIQQRKTTATLEKRTKSGSSWGGWSPAGTCNDASTVDCRATLDVDTLDATSCTVNFNAAGNNTADVNKKVTTACPTTTTTLGANETCTGGSNGVTCSITNASASAPVTTNPDTCTTTYMGSTGTSITNGSSKVTICTAGTQNSWANVASSGSCTPSSTMSCQYSNGSWSNVATGGSCTATTLNSGSGAWTVTSGTTCRYWDTTANATWSAYANTDSCTAVDPSASTPYTVTLANRCNQTDSGWIGVSSCTPSSSGGQTITCGVATVGPIPAAPPCTAESAASSNSYTATTCETVVSGPTTVSSCTAASASSSNNYTATTCTAGSSGTSNTLSDVAEYYYVTDLRDQSLGNCTGALGGNVCANNVPPSGLDSAVHQHMTTFTMGLGARGKMTGSSTYKNLDATCNPATDGDYCAVLKGTTANGSTICPWQGSGTTCNWPTPSSGAVENIDDLWHAAINGRGDYFSAANPSAVSQGLTTALSSINSRVSSAAAAATSSLEPVAGDNFAYTAKYVTNEWSGELEAKEIDLENGAIATTALWSAGSQLTGQTKAACDNRVIKLFHSGATNNLVDFKWTTYACDGSGNPTGSAVTTLDSTEQAYFGNISSLSHYGSMSDGSGSTVNQKSQSLGAPLVNFIRGQRGNEDFLTNSTRYYRTRAGVLGDIANAQPLFVKAPFASYRDSGYSSFKSNNASRAPMVYVGANDGMLHAFNATTGAEAWAFIPRAVLPSLYQLADDGYSTRHRFFVDGTPTASDVFDGTNWRTIVVGGLNKGGKSFYALDVTDPASPKALWEFTDANLGYTYGNPLIGKLKDGHDTWAVFLTSGANNADGQGHLYVLNAVSGALIREIVTPSGSNLMKIAGWSDDDPVLDNTVSHVYGTDLDGNIWRFDVNDTIEPAGHEATLLMATKDSLGNSQPISTKPELGLVGTDIYVYVGTGQYLGDFDLSTTGKQSIYGIKDTMRVPTTTGGMVVTNGRADLQAQVLVQTGDSAELTTKRKVESCVSAPAGWYVDLPDSKERVNVDMKLQLGSLIVPSNVPGSDACQAGGYSWLNYFNANNGCSNTDTKIVSERLSDSLAVGINIVRLPSNKTVAIATTSDSGQITLTPPFSISNPEGRRLTWREINPP